MRMMSETELDNIIDSWIVEEKLCEGSLDNGLTDIKELKDDYYETLKNVAGKLKTNQYITLIINKFELKDAMNSIVSQQCLEYDDKQYGERFEILFCLDKNLELVENSIFCPAFGLIHRFNLKEIPNVNELAQREKTMKSTIMSLCNGEFITDFHKEFQPENWYYTTKKVTALHSFYVKDLEKAKKKKTESYFLNIYLGGYTGERFSLDCSTNDGMENIEKILQPRYYPMGRYPWNTKYGLSLMQQAAVNVITNGEGNIRSVNGPPGTGKTSLLSDVFAEFSVRQANEILNGKDLPSSIFKYNVVVASSNNGAVENIVKDFSSWSAVDTEKFKDELQKADYYTEAINSQNDSDQVENERYWGLFSIAGGRKKNINSMIKTIDRVLDSLESSSFDEDPYQRFDTLYRKIDKIKNCVQELYDAQKKLEGTKLKKEVCKSEYERAKTQLNKLNSNQNDLCEKIQYFKEGIKDKRNEVKIIKKKYYRNFSFGAVLTWLKEYRNEVKKIKDSIRNLKQEIKCKRKEKIVNISIIHEAEQNCQLKKDEYSRVREETEEANKSVEDLRNHELIIKFTDINNFPDFSKVYKKNTDEYNDFQKKTPWFNDNFRLLQSKLFIISLEVRKKFIWENKGKIRLAYKVWKDPSSNYKMNPEQAFSWINFLIPVIGTTFASLHGMFNRFVDTPINKLVVDEAGQALPQALVGGLIRCKDLTVLGDPTQIKPVLSLSHNIVNLLQDKYQVDPDYLSENSSVQTLCDKASKYCFYNQEKNITIGMPLWVHRRCQKPIFEISNQIAYDELMVYGTADSDQCTLKWKNISGNADNKYVKAQGEWVRDQVRDMKDEDKKNVYIITPFRNVAERLRELMEESNIFSGDEVKSKIGTVHTFQGKEANTVYLILGADENSLPAANWAWHEPNLINVAATRAKHHLIIVGDIELYKNFPLAERVIGIVKNYGQIEY